MRFVSLHQLKTSTMGDEGVVPAALPAHAWRARVRAWLARRALAVVLTAFATLATISSIVVPPFETPDEIWHFAFIQQVASGGGLPTWEPGAEMLWKQQGGQAPAYYLAAAALTAWIDQSDFRALYAQANPYASIGLPDLLNRGFLVHYPEAEWPWRGSVLALHVARLFSVSLATVALWAIFQTLRLLLGVERALGGTALVAFIPQFIFIGGAASNDNAIIATSALLVWRLVALARAGDASATDAERAMLHQGQTYLVIGLFLGLALLSKLNGIALVGVTALTLLVVARRARSWRVLARGGLLVGGVALLVSGWWYLRNFLLYGDWLAQQIWITSSEPRADLDWRSDLRSVEFSFWGLFGWFNVAYPTPMYTLFRAVTWLAFMGLGIEAARWWGAGRRMAWWRVVAVGLLLVWVVGFALSWAQFNRVMIAAQGRLFMPLLPVVALLLAVGLSGWRVRASQPPVLAWGVVGGLFALSVLTPWFLIRPAYLPSATLAWLPEGAVPLGILYGDALVLEGYTVTPTQLAPSQPLDLTLYWRAVEPIDEELAVAVKLFGREGALLARDDSYPDGARWPTRAWPTGTLITDRKRLWVSGEAETPTLAEVTVDVYRPATLEQLPATVGGAGVTLPVRVGELLVREAEAEPAAPAAYLYRPVVERVSLEAESIEVAFVWEVGQQLAGDYRALFHLAPSADAPPVAQADFEPLGGDLPTSAWWPGDRLADGARLPLPEGIAAGEYVVLLGLYDAATSARVAGEATPGVWVVARLRWDGETWSILD